MNEEEILLKVSNSTLQKVSFAYENLGHSYRLLERDDRIR